MCFALPRDRPCYVAITYLVVLHYIVLLIFLVRKYSPVIDLRNKDLYNKICGALHVIDLKKYSYIYIVILKYRYFDVL